MPAATAGGMPGPNSGTAYCDMPPSLAAYLSLLGHIFPVWLTSSKAGRAWLPAFGCLPAAFSPGWRRSPRPRMMGGCRGPHPGMFPWLPSSLRWCFLFSYLLWLSPRRYGYVSGTAMFACCWLVILKHRRTSRDCCKARNTVLSRIAIVGSGVLGNCAGPEAGSARGSLHCPVVSFGRGSRVDPEQRENVAYLSGFSIPRACNRQ